jgi:protein-tyrosine phosphatase
MKILFVCTGNICRSPLAEGILRHKLKQRGIPAAVDSAGFENFHVNDPPDERAIRTGRKYGIDITGHRGRLLTVQDLVHFDRIYVMDAGHYRGALRLAQNEEQERKIDFLMNAVHPGKNIPVPDPWYDGMEAFEEAYSQIDQACERIALMLAEENK